MSDNTKRAAAAQEALAKYAEAKGDMEWENDMTRLSDLLTDLMHLCHRKARDENCPMDFHDALTTARVHFEAEQ